MPGGWKADSVEETCERQSVASNVVKLGKFRKKKKREENAKKADINRIRHGRTQAEKDKELAERERAARLLEGKRLEPAPPPGTDEPEEP